ncbi:MAG: HD-GYP domain-containing protein [Deltaproteobacteria bacterium]|nr:HD-GYP domain-containing protein [Deltaproteobacteria bacterium]
MVLGDRATASLENALLYADLESTFRETIQGLALALETKDAYTHGHSENVTRLAVATARQMGLDHEFCETLRQAGLLHDIGKIGISSSILNKPGRLTPEEYEIIKSHPAMGRRILEPISFLREVVPIVYHHHERFDGEGYPEGLTGEEIPLASRVMAVADTYDAMTSDRAYRRGLSHDVAVAELDRCAGTQFDPECVRAFLAAHPEPNRKP